MAQSPPWAVTVGPIHEPARYPASGPFASGPRSIDPSASAGPLEQMEDIVAKVRAESHAEAKEAVTLFGGDPHAIVVIGYSVGAFHVATFLAHRELQVTDSHIAGAVLLSGIYSPEADADRGERAYLGADTTLYKARSAFPGIFEVEEPIVLAWSTLDSPGLVAQAENLDKGLCGAGHCPRTALLAGRDSPASVFGLDATDKALAGQMRELVDEIEARGLP